MLSLFVFFFCLYIYLCLSISGRISISQSCSHSFSLSTIFFLMMCPMTASLILTFSILHLFIYFIKSQTLLVILNFGDTCSGDNNIVIATTPLCMNAVSTNIVLTLSLIWQQQRKHSVRMIRMIENDKHKCDHYSLSLYIFTGVFLCVCVIACACLSKNTLFACYLPRVINNVRGLLPNLASTMKSSSIHFLFFIESHLPLELAKPPKQGTRLLRTLMRKTITLTSTL